MVTTPEPAQPAQRRKLPYAMERDFAPVWLVAIGASVLVVHPSVPACNVKELIGLARSQPGKLSYGSSGVASSAHLEGELFKSMAKVNIVHVSYKGSPEVVVATASGHSRSRAPCARWITQRAPRTSPDVASRRRKAGAAAQAPCRRFQNARCVSGRRRCGLRPMTHQRVW